MTRVTRPGARILTVAGLLLVMSTACAQREPAREAIAAMRTATIEQGRMVRESMHAVVTAYFDEVGKGLQARVELRAAELREEIHRRADARLHFVTEVAVAQLEHAMSGTIDRLDARLREEQSKPLYERDRARELELAAQLAATLAALGVESDRLVQRTARDVAEVRRRALRFVDDRVVHLRRAPEIVLDARALASDVLEDFERASAAHDRRMVDGLYQLERYVDQPENAAGEFATGLLGARLGEIVAARSGKVIRRAEDFLGREMGEAQRAAIERLETLD